MKTHECDKKNLCYEHKIKDTCHVKFVCVGQDGYGNAMFHWALTHVRLGKIDYIYIENCPWCGVKLEVNDEHS